MILDTDGLSAIADGDAALEPTLRKAAKVAVPAIVLGEYQYFTCKVHAKKSDKMQLQVAAELENSVWNIGGID